MVRRLSRRALLAGAGSSVARAAFADAPLTSPRPLARIPARDAIAKLVADTDVTGTIGLVVRDLKTGAMMEQIVGDAELPPASVTKAFTALYALETLGPTYAFDTRVFAGGNLESGILDGNLILAGGGNPNLVTDDLADLAQKLKETGLREVKGDFLVWDEALINLEEVDSDQLDHLGYNPSVTGLNLNYNRVHFEWKRNGNGFDTFMDARSERYRPAVTTSRMRIVDRDDPVFTYRAADNVDHWTVARSALNAEGSRWLPVRHPAVYAGEVFATFARSQGIVLKPPQEMAGRPQGVVLATHRGAPLEAMMRRMLRYSTNITAEAAGLSATARMTGQQRGLRTSALSMARWAASRATNCTPYFVDHSGLGDQSRVTPHDMVNLLMADGARDTLLPILRAMPLSDGNGETVKNANVVVRAKTGTLNFVSSLAGYMTTARSQDLAFAIFIADLEAREQGKRQGDERPPGARSWNRRARSLQTDVLRHLALRTA